MTDTNQDFAQDSVVDTAHTQAPEHDIDGQPVATAEQEADTGEKTPEQEQAEQEAEQRKHKTRAQKRIAELTWQKNEAERKLAALEAAKPQEEQGTAKPKAEDFETWSEFEEAKDAWLQEQAEKRVMEKLKGQQPAQQQQGQDEYQTQIMQSADDLRTHYTDFDEVLRQGVERAASVPLPINVDQLGLPAKDLLNLAYTLSKDEDLYYELASMTPQQAMLRLGQVMAKTTTPAGKKAAVSRAPAPIKPVSANAPASRSPYEMSDKEFFAANNIR